MERHKSLFSKLEQEPNGALYNKVLTKIKHAEMKRARVNLFGLGLISLVSLIAFVPIVSYVRNEMQVSGFFSYFSILFSNSGAVLSNWREFALALTESVPVLGIILFFATTLIFLSSLRTTVKNIYVARLSF